MKTNERCVTEGAVKERIVQNKRRRVLLIQSDANDARRTRDALSAGTDVSYQIDGAESLADAVSRLQTKSYDAALLDLSLAESNAVETVAHFWARCPKPPPLVLLAGLGDEAAAMESLCNGAQDYVLKSDLRADTLSHAIHNAIQSHHCLVKLRAANDMLNVKNQRLSELYDTAQQFVDNVSHEFRTPLTVIREFTSIVRDGCDGPVTPRQIEHLDKVLNRTDDLALMVDDMLDISNLEAGRLGVWRRPSQVTELIANVISSLRTRAESKNIRLVGKFERDLPQAFCDEAKAQRVLINLAVNAIKFTPEGGHVEIWARPADDGADIVVGVTDSGPGISPQDLESVFQRFKQLEINLRASTKGFGLGLNIAKELVNLNLGQMHVESELGKGSTFSFTLPCNDRAIVFDRYAKRIVALSNALSEISFVTASIDADEHTFAQVVDEYLQHSVRSNDLTLQTSDHTWLIVMSCPERDVSTAIDRLNQGWRDYARNYPAGELPALHLAHCCTWPLSAGLSRLSEEFSSLIEGRAVKGLLRGTVLVVDDDREVSVCMRVRLQMAGYKVLSAYDGEEGLAAVLEHRPDAVVLDVRMPKMDGITMLQRMRSNALTEDTPVVILSANIRDQHRALDAGANYFVSKPYEATAVLSAIDSSLCERAVHE